MAIKPKVMLGMITEINLVATSIDFNADQFGCSTC